MSAPFIHQMPAFQIFKSFVITSQRDSPDFRYDWVKTLESQKYGGCVKESLRLTHGYMTRRTRTDQDQIKTFPSEAI